MLKALSDNNDGNISSSLINLYHYIAECYEDEFLPAAEDSSAMETTSMMNDVEINIS